jgi:tetratricopeptide (TPR) repeat protein
MKTFFGVLLLTICATSFGQQRSQIKVYKKTFTTYPFSDPNPIPDPTARFYPYFRFDGYTNTPVQKEWKVVELENDFIKVLILPEIGGKIWTAIEKKSGREFIYNNHVVKFRDIAMRGAWTSGGIEANYGTIGHTPNCATPVDYTTVKKADGSVSCVVGALDLLTRTRWRLEINLPSDKAYFTTNSFWYNASGVEQPYYHWMNAGIKAAGNLEFVYLGVRFLGHAGETGDWPINTKNGRDVSWYENNNFGGYKSYHVFGRYTDFFGGYWHDDELGVVRYSTHDDKPGKKLWIWGLSPQGMIWEKLLTDNDGQYVELQSGRLYNQSAEASARTPFKHRGFAPYASDTWTEYWFPVVNTKGFVSANLFGAINVKRENGWLKFYISPVQSLRETLFVRSNGKALYNRRVSLTPLNTFADSVRLPDPSQKIEVRLREDKLFWKEDLDDTLSRPASSPENFDHNSAYGLYLQGKNLMYFREYRAAEEKLRACLEKESGFVPALTDLAIVLYRRMRYDEALQSLKKALSINTYDPAANYYYGLINRQLGKRIDAIDGFDMATQSEEFRTPAFTELAKMYFSPTGKTNEKAIHYATKALAYNQQNIDALQILAMAYRKQNDGVKARAILERLGQYDQLNVFAKFERFLWNKSDASRASVISSVQNEMPDQSYLELALWYYTLGCVEESKQVLQLSRSTAEVNYWLAFLGRNTPAELTYYEKAKASKSQTAFPFRTESIAPLRWFINHTHEWQPAYYAALIEAACGNLDSAKLLLLECGTQPDDAVFYSTRAKLGPETRNAESDMKRAVELDPQQWRYYKQLTDWYNGQGRIAEGLSIAKTYCQKNPAHYIMGMLLAKTHLLNREFREAARILDTIVVIPYEGATDGRRLYKEAHLMLAVEALKQKNFEGAINEVTLAKSWPERLGVGRPYSEDVDERLEDYLLYQCYSKLGDSSKAEYALHQIRSNKAHLSKLNDAITRWVEGDRSALENVPPDLLNDENGRVFEEWRKRQ